MKRLLTLVCILLMAPIVVFARAAGSTDTTNSTTKTTKTATGKKTGKKKGHKGGKKSELNPQPLPPRKAPPSSGTPQ